MSTRARGAIAVAAMLLAGMFTPARVTAQSAADTSRVFASWAEWRRAYDELVAAIDDFESLTRVPIDSAERLAAVVTARERVYGAARGPDGYLYLRLQLSGADEEARSRRGLLDEADSRWYSTLAPWFERSIASLGREQVGEWVASHPALEHYEFFFRRFFEQADHSFPAGEERLRTLADVSRRQSTRVYNAVAVAEMPAIWVTLESGERSEVKPAPPRTVLGSISSPADRRAVDRAWLEALGLRSQTYAALLEGIVEQGRLVAEVRGFDSALSASLHADAIPAETVRSVIRAAREDPSHLRRYHELRRTALGIDDYGLADRFVPLAQDAATEIGFDEARRLILEASATLGPEVEAVVARAFSEGWIDSIERPGKRPNAGSTFVAGHPFVYLTYRGSIDNVFQLAHEIGHAVHAHLAYEAQPFIYSHRSTVTSETVASVFEGVLLDRLIGELASRQQVIRVLDLSIQNILRLFYRPMLDADFELRVYEGDLPITGPSLDTLYRDVVTDYYGESVRLEDWDVHGWQRTPHFFTAPLYLGRYGLAAAAAELLIPRLTSEAPVEAAAARRDFLELMRAGASDHALDLLRRAGADLGGEHRGQAVVGRLGSLVDELTRAVESGQRDSAGIPSR